MIMDEMSSVQKLEWIRQMLDELIRGDTITEHEVEQAQLFVEDIIELFMDDLK